MEINRDNQEMYERRNRERKKKQWTGYSCIINSNGEMVTAWLPIGITRMEWNRKYRHINGMEIKYQEK